MLEWLEQCGAVVVILGVTEALGWEIEQIIQRRYLHKALFVLPPVGKGQLQKRCERLDHHLRARTGKPLPQPEQLSETLLIGFHRSQAPFLITARDRLPFSYRVAFATAAQIREQ